MPSPDELLAAELAKQESEWGTYVAAAPIFIGGARAFNPGDPVPVSHVTGGVVNQAQVTQAAQAPADEEPPAASETDNAAENGTDHA
jgi:hypothetical protein